MSLERELHEHFNRAGGALPAPPDRLGDVVRRGRRRRIAQGGLLAAVAAATAFSLPTVVDDLTQTRVDLAPAEPIPGLPSEASETSQTEPPVAERGTESPPTDVATESPTREVPAPELVSADKLGAPVLTYRPGSQDIEVRGGNSRQVPHDLGNIDIAFPDGQGGVVIQSGQRILWSPAPRQTREQPTTLFEGDRDPVLLRGLHPDGRVIFSVTDDKRAEDMQERFYLIGLGQGGAPDQIGETYAYESWTIGPTIVADGTFVHAGCHMVCSMYPGVAEPPRNAEELYPGRRELQTAIDGLVSTFDGRVIGFVETPPGLYGNRGPTLVLLDGRTFEDLARIPLPVSLRAMRRLAADTVNGLPEVSISPDGTRVLVSIGRTFLIDQPYGATPSVRRVDFDGVARWMDLRPDSVGG